MDNLLVRTGRRTMRLKSDVTTNPTICATLPAPESAITSATVAPRAKKSKKNEIERSSPTKARVATAAQRIISRSKAIITPPLERNFTPASLQPSASRHNIEWRRYIKKTAAETGRKAFHPISPDVVRH